MESIALCFVCTRFYLIQLRLRQLLPYISHDTSIHDIISKCINRPKSRHIQQVSAWSAAPTTHLELQGTSSYSECRSTRDHTSRLHTARSDDERRAHAILHANSCSPDPPAKTLWLPLSHIILRGCRRVLSTYACCHHIVFIRLRSLAYFLELPAFATHECDPLCTGVIQSALSYNR